VRGEDIFQESLFTTTPLETFVPTDHPLRSIRALLYEGMNQLSGLFDSIEAQKAESRSHPNALSVLSFCRCFSASAVNDNSLNKLTTTCSIAGLSD
jgi:hypothetical protein